MTLEEISPELFLWELYNPNGMYELDDALCMHESSFGWCDASRLKVRPKAGEIALMVEWYNGTKYWCHADKKILDSIRYRIARMNEALGVTATEEEVK
jgi:hypothetical protein